MTDLLEVPDWPMIHEDLMSNFDHEVDAEVAQRLRTEQVLAPYPGWDFHADCWFADDQFHAAVFVYHVHRATLSADTPQELMELVSNEYGAR